MKFAVQLYSVRDHIKTGDDMLAVLGKVKEIGFDGVEFAGYFGLDAEALRKRCDELGLAVVGTHIELDAYYPENLANTLEYHKTLGCKYIGVGGAAHGTLEDAERTGDVLGKAGLEAKKLGMDTYYHNHWDEFLPFADSDKCAEDVIKERCNLEVDTYWSFTAGVDNEAFLKENKDKILLVHIKDGINKHPKALGEGECDLKKVVAGVKAIGLDWVILENDNPEPDGLSDISRSFKWLKANF